MKMNTNQLLVITSDDSAQAISKGMDTISGTEIIRANCDADAIELIMTHSFMLVFVQESLPGITPLKIGTRLANQEHSKVTPMVLITNSSAPLDLFEPLPSLRVDFLPTPLDPILLKAKIKIFFELYQNKISVTQSIDELDHAYEKIMHLQKESLKEQEMRKEMISHSTAFAGQMQSPLKNIQAGAYQLQKARDLPPSLIHGVNHIRNATQQITQITKRISTLAALAPKRLTRLTDAEGVERPCCILYVTGSKDEFDIFRHYIKGALNCSIQQAHTLAQAKEIIISTRQLDLIFSDHQFADGTGFDLLSDPILSKSDTPLIFTLENSQMDMGAQALVKGADNFFIKEKISTRNILSIIWETLEKSKLSKEIRKARERIVLISQKDHLTRLYNRQYFNQTLNIEIGKVIRYQLPLSILIVNFDKFKLLNQTHGYETCDQILITSAALIQSMVRNIDLVCRYGGNEFAIMLPNTSPQGAKILGERILKEISLHNFGIDKNTIHLTVSIGLASPKQTDPLSPPSQGLVKQAMDAVGLAVQQGGNTLQYLPGTKKGKDQTHD